MKMTDNELKLVRSALLAVEESEVRAFRKFPAVDTPHSEEHLVNMSELIDRTEHPVRRLSRRKVVAIAIAAAVLVALCLGVVAEKAGILDFFEERFEDHLDLTEPDSETDIIETAYAPTYVPDGFVTTNFDTSIAGVYVLWETADSSEYISYLQSPMNGDSLNFDTENVEYSTVVVGGTNKRCFKKNGTVTLVWHDGTYSYMLQCPESIGWEEIEKIVLSIAEQ